MFNFQRLKVYEKARKINKEIRTFLERNRILDPFLRDQLKRASIGIVVNIAEGSGKKLSSDKANYYTLSREYVYECVSLVELFYDDGNLSATKFVNFVEKYEELSKMLTGLIKYQNQ